MPRESEFTPPSSRCPEPELWEAPDADSTELEVTGARRRARPGDEAAARSRDRHQPWLQQRRRLAEP